MNRTPYRALAFVVSLATASPAVAAEPRPPHPSEATVCQADDGRDPDRGRASFAAGLGLTITGLTAGLLIGLPAMLLRRNAREDAAKATYEARQRRYARRADRRETVGFAALGTGAVMVLIGVPLMVVGARAKRSNRTALTPVLTPTMAGMNASVRF